MSSAHAWMGSQAPRSIIAGLLLGLGVCVAGLVVPGAPAAAADTGYCRILVSPRSAYADNDAVLVDGVTYVENHVHYSGSGTIRVCGHTYFWSCAQWVTRSRACGPSHTRISVTSGSKLYRGYYPLSTVSDDSEHRHTINGHAYDH